MAKYKFDKNRFEKNRRKFDPREKLQIVLDAQLFNMHGIEYLPRLIQYAQSEKFSFRNYSKAFASIDVIISDMCIIEASRVLFSDFFEAGKKIKNLVGDSFHIRSSGEASEFKLLFTIFAFDQKEEGLPKCKGAAELAAKKLDKPIELNFEATYNNLAPVVADIKLRCEDEMKRIALDIYNTYKDYHEWNGDKNLWQLKERLKEYMRKEGEELFNGSKMGINEKIVLNSIFKFYNQDFDAQIENTFKNYGESSIRSLRKEKSDAVRIIISNDSDLRENYFYSGEGKKVSNIRSDAGFYRNFVINEYEYAAVLQKLKMIEEIEDVLPSGLAKAQRRNLEKITERGKDVHLRRGTTQNIENVVELFQYGRIRNNRDMYR